MHRCYILLFPLVFSLASRICLLSNFLFSTIRTLIILCKTFFLHFLWNLLYFLRNFFVYKEVRQVGRIKGESKQTVQTLTLSVFHYHYQKICIRNLIESTKQKYCNELKDFSPQKIFWLPLTLPDVGGGHYSPPTLEIAGIQNFEKQPGLIRPDFS